MTTQEEVNTAIVSLAFGLIFIVLGFWLGGLMILGFALIGIACLLPMIRLWLEDMKNDQPTQSRHKRRF